VQFTVGIRDAKTIVAVNTDQNAFIWQMTDYGIVGDLNEVVPRLTAALKG
jgi:electron transfer flavoprotein alpha subunit